MVARKTQESILVRATYRTSSDAAPRVFLLKFVVGVTNNREREEFPSLWFMLGKVEFPSLRVRLGKVAGGALR